ncbi:MAG: MFS transporter, partial [Alphaproteobacteria bacterium]
MAHPREPRKALIAWCLYDWANSAFPTIISTFIFATYFTTAVAPDKTTGTVMWGNTLAVSGVAIAVLAPIMGAISDARGPRKSSLALFTALAVACAALLWFVTPDPSAIWPALILVGLGTLGFELSLVFYNAMLPELAPPGRLGRWSGWGWGLGYLGGLCCLVIALFGLIQADPPPFGLARESAEHIRATTILVALWFALFSLP